MNKLFLSVISRLYTFFEKHLLFILGIIFILLGLYEAINKVAFFKSIPFVVGKPAIVIGVISIAVGFIGIISDILINKRRK